MLHFVYFGFHTGHKQQSPALVLPNHLFQTLLHTWTPFPDVIITVAAADQGTSVCVIISRCLSVVVYSAGVNDK